MTKRGSIRIIGGRWRRRRIAVPEGDAIRPTPDRVRETVFNWLAPTIGGARCLDLFAGSGAFGIEAASRGAQHVVMVEREPALAEKLIEEVNALGAGEQVSVRRSDALALLELGAAEPFDVVFVDPPYGNNLEGPVCAALDAGGWLAEDALIYVETNRAAKMQWPADWEVLREKEAGQVRYYLARSTPARADGAVKQEEC